VREGRPILLFLFLFSDSPFLPQAKEERERDSEDSDFPSFFFSLFPPPVSFPPRSGRSGEDYESSRGKRAALLFFFFSPFFKSLFESRGRKCKGIAGSRKKLVIFFFFFFFFSPPFQFLFFPLRATRT